MGMERIGETDEIGWVRAAQKGNREAFGCLVEAYQGVVYGQCLRLAANRADAEDWAHDALVQAFLQIRQLGDPARFGAWLKAIALNVCRSHFRRQYRSSEMLAEEPGAALEGVENDLWEQVSGALWRLSPAQRLVLALYYWEGLSYEEIACFVDVPVGTVMSRLYRARSNLKDKVDGFVADSEAEMVRAPDLKKEIEAEIDALGRLFGEDPASMERLSVLLRHSPGRFARLIEEMAPAEEEPLVHLLKRLGTPAIEVALDCYFDRDQPTSQRARKVLCALVAQDQSWYEDKDWSNLETSYHATQTTYALLDRIVARQVKDAAKVELLLALAKAARAPRVGGVCCKVLLCYPAAAFALLSRRLAQTPITNVLMPPLEATLLVRFGTRFCRYVLEKLDATAPADRLVGLSGLVALAKQLNPGYMLAKEKVAFERSDERFRDHWHLLSRDVNAAALDELVERCAALALGEGDTEREAALFALGALRRCDEVVGQALSQCLAHTERTTRIAALMALCEIGDALGGLKVLAATQTEQRILALARVEDRAEKVAALTALGRLQVGGARALMTESATSSTAADVREAAVNGLGQIGGEESVVLLRQLQVSGAKDLRKKASRWLARLEAKPRAAPTPAQVARRKRLDRFRGDKVGDAYFPTHRFHINLEGCIRSLPEIRTYPEMELTRYFAQVCRDYSYTRRVLADRGLLHREGGICQLTEMGQGVWRVEHFIMLEYLRGIDVLGA